VVTLTIGILAYWGTQAFDRSGASVSETPALYPRLLSIVLCLLGSALVIRALVSEKPRDGSPGARNTGIGNAGFWRMGKVVLFLVGYSVGIYFFGFILPSLLFLYGMPLQLGASKRTALLVSAPLTVALYVTFFLLFKVPVPHGVAFR
jgi:hypothetical protein